MLQIIGFLKITWEDLFLWLWDKVSCILVPIRVCWSSNTDASTSKVVGLVVGTTTPSSCSSLWPQASRSTNWATSPAPRERVLWECFSSWSNSNFMEKLQRHTENCCEPFTQLLLLKQTQDFFLLKLWSKSVKWDSLMIRSNHQYFFLSFPPHSLKVKASLGTSALNPSQ